MPPYSASWRITVARNRFGIEGDAVIHSDRDDFPEVRDEYVAVGGAEAEQVSVARRAMRLVVPKGKEQGAFQQEPVGVAGRRHATQQPFQSKRFKTRL